MVVGKTVANKNPCPHPIGQNAEISARNGKRVKSSKNAYFYFSFFVIKLTTSDVNVTLDEQMVELIQEKLL